MLARRLLLLAAVLLLLTALASALAPSRTDTDDAPPVRTSLPAGETVTMSIPAEESATTRVPVERGDRLELEVTGALLDSVLIERLDRMDGIAPGTPARFDIVIDAAPGSYPIRLIEADRRIGSIVVSE